MSLLMNDADIAKEYREAKNPYAQLQILADENCADEREIIEALIRQGVPEASEYRRRYAVLYRMLRGGASDSQIARTLGIPLNETTRMRRMLGIRRPRR